MSEHNDVASMVRRWRRRDLVGHAGRCFDSAVRSGMLATASEDSTARLWELESGACVGELRGHVDEVLRLAWGPEAVEMAAGAPILATAGADGSALLWRLGDQPKLLRQLTVGDQVYGCAWLEQTWLVTASDVAKLWDVAAGRVARDWSYEPQKGARADVFDLDPGPPNVSTLVACALADGTVRVHDYRNPSLAAVLTLPGDGRTTAVAWRADGGSLAACCGSGATLIYDLRTWQLRASRSTSSNPVYGAAWWPTTDKETVVSWSSDGALAFWDLDNDTAAGIIQTGIPVYHANAPKNNDPLVIVGGDEGPHVVLYEPIPPLA